MPTLTETFRDRIGHPAGTFAAVLPTRHRAAFPTPPRVTAGVLHPAPAAGHRQPVGIRELFPVRPEAHIGQTWPRR